MTKLHEILAVESDLKSRASSTLADIVGLFKSGSGKLLGQIATYQVAIEGEQPHPPKITNMATTVNRQLELLGTDFSGWIDVAIQKEVTNGGTEAKITISGREVLLPATALLNLENKLEALRTVYKAIPTNDVTLTWVWDADNECFRSERPEIRRSTRKTPRSYVAYEATKEHPAQVQVYNEDVTAGQWETIKQSGMITPSDQRQRLARLDKLIREVKQARQRANNIEIVPVKIGKDIFAYINGE